MKPCPAIMTLALRSCLRPPIGRGLAVSRPWSAWTRLLAYRSLRCQPPAAAPPAPAGRSGPGRSRPRWGDLGGVDGPLAAPAGGACIPPRRDIHLEDLPQLIDARSTYRQRPATLTYLC